MKSPCLGVDDPSTPAGSTGPAVDRDCLPCSHRCRSQCPDGFYDREFVARCAANFMSALCPTASDLATEKTALNHFFYPQSYPQLSPASRARKSRHALFCEVVLLGKSAAACWVWKTTRFDIAIFEHVKRLFMSIDSAFDRASLQTRAHARAAGFRRRLSSTSYRAICHTIVSC